ncbi:endonuclease/exonuclease/phosphatase family protein [Dyadobacter crusticola]|uniref:endonuclease/exonuclease/phosphatase family protein n=1 Tax=Dyadobacter crusticola TaxID=292407 RepID=UPI00146FB648|nr:endonuclease [Dyadobacter crusticola]
MLGLISEINNTFGMIKFKTKDRQPKRTLWLLLLLPALWGNTTTRETPYLHNVQGAATDTSSSGSFSVISYNIAGLPQLISSAATDRAPSIREIGARLNDFDIVHVQEDFNYNRTLYSENKHPFRTISKGKIPFGDGLNTLSRFPVRDLQRIKWEDCTGADCLTPKGFTFSRVEIARAVFIDFYNVHANAYNHPAAAKARRQNIAQLADYIRRNSAGNAVILMGDLNGRYSYNLDNISVLQQELGLQDVWVESQNEGKLPEPLAVTPAKDILSIDNDAETIDKILYRSSAAIQIETTDYEFEKSLFSTAEGVPLSDHHPVTARFSWRVNAQSPAIFAANPNAKRQVR